MSMEEISKEVIPYMAIVQILTIVLSKQAAQCANTALVEMLD
jgi:hypothetical protein